jgi:hypothetical protein
MAFFWRDEKTVLLQKTDPSAGSFTIELTASRRVRAIKDLYPEGNPTVQIPKLFVDEKIKQKHYYVLNSSSISIFSSTPNNKYVLTYYQTPELSPIPKSWLMDMYPMEVIDGALLNLYLDQRDSSQADRYRVIVGRAKEDKGTHMWTIWTDQLQQNADF